MDESLPQHYGIPTACLDWTYNPYIAIYFALQNIPTNATHISIFAYQEIQENDLIMIKEGKPDKNPRLRAQQEVLISIVPACIFYFCNNR